MPFSVSIFIGYEIIPAEFNDSVTSKSIYDILPVESEFSTWGDEIYFPIPISLPEENGTDSVNIGEICYWPPGNALCIFYGKTPVSTDNEIRPASPVNQVGIINGNTEIFKTLANKKQRIRIEKNQSSKEI